MDIRPELLGLLNLMWEQIFNYYMKCCLWVGSSKYSRSVLLWTCMWHMYGDWFFT